MSLDKALDMMYEFFEKEAKKGGGNKGVKSRNRPSPVFQSTHPKVTDNKDHFPLKDEDQARNALSQVAKYTKSKPPKWWSGTVEEVKSAVRRRVKSKYPSIEVTEGKKKSKKAEEYLTEEYLDAIKKYSELKTTADEHEVFYGPPIPEDSSPKLDYALELVSMYEGLLNKLLKREFEFGNSGEHHNYKMFKKIYEEELEKYKKIVEKLSGVSL